MEEFDDIDIGYINVPRNYFKLSEDTKKHLCESIIDSMLWSLDKELPEEIDRLDYLKDIFESTIKTNERDELYEICEVIKDCRKILND